MAKVYDLEARTLLFAQDTIRYVNKLPSTIPNLEIARQLARSSSSVGANYREANDALGKKDFLMHVRISRKESKESAFFLQLSEPLPEMKTEQARLTDESFQLMKIFGAILSKSQSPRQSDV
jgi:four helix bundle protein